jgi:hypothetical protein
MSDSRSSESNEQRFDPGSLPRVPVPENFDASVSTRVMLNSLTQVPVPAGFEADVLKKIRSGQSFIQHRTFRTVSVAAASLAAGLTILYFALRSNSVDTESPLLPTPPQTVQVQPVMPSKTNQSQSEVVKSAAADQPKVKRDATKKNHPATDSLTKNKEKVQRGGEVTPAMRDEPE